MMQKRKTKGAAFYIFAAVFLVCSLAEIVECSRRWKPLRIDVRKEVNSTEPVGFYEGEILFGISLKGPDSQLINDTNQPPSNASVEDESDYQADFPGFPFDQFQMNAWNQMRTSLLCGPNQMDFRVFGSGHRHFEVDPLNGPSLPFPTVPQSCGYNMRRFPFALHISIPYSGCNVLNRGGRYMLPLTWRGIPIVLSCQMPPSHFQNWHPWSNQFPMSQFPMSQFPMSQFPMSQFPMSQFPMSQFPMSQFPMSQFPMSQFPLNPLAGNPTTAPQGSVPWPMDPLRVQQPGVTPWGNWNVNPALRPAAGAPAAIPQMPWRFPFPWYHSHPHYHPYWL